VRDERGVKSAKTKTLSLSLFENLTEAAKELSLSLSPPASDLNKAQVQRDKKNSVHIYALFFLKKMNLNLKLSFDDLIGHWLSTLRGADAARVSRYLTPL
jgi:hypothetical protein